MKALIQPLLAFLRAPKSRRRAHSRGQTLVEYALVTSMMAVLGVAIVTLLNTRIETVFSVIANELDTAQSSH